MLMLASLMMVGGFSAIAEAATCTKASLKGKWYFQQMLVNYSSAGSGQSTEDIRGSLSFTNRGKVTFNVVAKEVDPVGGSATVSISFEGTYVVSKSCIATLTIPGDPGESGAVLKLRVFPTKGLFMFLGEDEEPREVGLGFGIKAE